MVNGHLVGLFLSWGAPYLPILNPGPRRIRAEEAIGPYLSWVE